jgi:tetratricopeptide (TPR) repeat protein
VIRGGFAISGLFDLRPLRFSRLQPMLQLTEDIVQTQSPLLRLPDRAPPLFVSVGGAESSELRRQSADYLHAWKAAGLRGWSFEQPEANHFLAVRDRYVGAAARINQSLRLIVAASWLVEAKRPGFDARAAAATYHKLMQTKSAKDNPDLAVELLCAEAIMLDEYSDHKDGALEVLRVAQEAYPNDYRLNRQRQRVFYRHHQHAEALAEFEKFQDRVPKERAVDGAYAMREAGRSAAETGDLERARIFFEQA